MGELFLHDLQKYIDKHGCNVFMETGTGVGTGLDHATKYPFERLYSVEINETLFDRAQEKYLRNEKVHLMCGESSRAVGMALSKEQGNTFLFWLDAHFPGADFQLGKYDDDIPDNVKMPLYDELVEISTEKTKHVIIIDDLQLYEDGPYELKYPAFIDKYKRKPDFIYSLFEKTHTFTKDYRHQGFLILEPK